MGLKRPPLAPLPGSTPAASTAVALGSSLSELLHFVNLDDVVAPVPIDQLDVGIDPRPRRRLVHHNRHHRLAGTNPDFTEVERFAKGPAGPEDPDIHQISHRNVVLNPETVDPDLSGNAPDRHLVLPVRSADGGGPIGPEVPERDALEQVCTGVPDRIGRYGGQVAHQIAARGIRRSFEAVRRHETGQGLVHGRLADQILERVERQRSLVVNEVTAAYFKQMAKTETGAVRADLERVAAGSREAMLRVARSSTSWNATLRTTCVATMLDGGHAMNALPQLAAATINCRVLPEDEPDYVEAALRKVVADSAVAISRVNALGRGPASPLRPDVMSAVSEITTAMWPGVVTVPIMVMGATDGRMLRSAGIPTYGVQGFFFDRDDIRFHGRDERIRVQSFFEGHAFLYQLVKQLAGAKPIS